MVVNLVICLAIVLPGTMVVATTGTPYISLFVFGGRELTCVCSEEGRISKECDKSLREEFLAAITCRRCEKTGNLSPEKPKFMSPNFDAEGKGSR